MKKSISILFFMFFQGLYSSLLILFSVLFAKFRLVGKAIFGLILFMSYFSIPHSVFIGIN